MPSPIPPPRFDEQLVAPRPQTTSMHLKTTPRTESGAIAALMKDRLRLPDERPALGATVITSSKLHQTMPHDALP